MTLRGPSIPEREQMMQRAYEHAMKDEHYEAIGAFEELLALGEPPAQFVSSYATELMHFGRTAEAAVQFERALALRPEKLQLRESIIFCRDHCEDTTAELAYRLRREYWQEHGMPLAANIEPHANDPDPERPLRVGYVSGDFRHHSANYSFSPIIVRHSPAIEVFCYYSANPSLWDSFTTIYSQEKTLRVIDGIMDETAAMLIRRDKIDILVDLGAYANGGRLGLFARKPAPVQITAWGYVLGTGLDTVDAIFGDPITMPLSTQEYFSERIVHLPSTLPFMGQLYAPEVSLLPCVAAKPRQPFTFGSFNRAPKINEGTLRMWGKILQAVPDSRLLLKEGNLVHSYWRARVLATLGVSPDRVLFEGQTSHLKHLDAYGRADLALDPYPMGGGVTLLEGLWQGVPAIVRRGPPGARVCTMIGPSVLTLLGMDDFIADDEDAYVRLAVAWATQGREALSQWRLRLRSMMFASPLIQGYVEAVEDAYRTLWRTWCQDPQASSVSPGASARASTLAHVSSAR